MKKIFLIYLISMSGICAYAQETQKAGSEASEEEFHPKHSVSLTIGHEHSFNGRDDEGNRKTLILPFWGLDYNFQFSRHFQVGLHTDFIVESFKVEKNTGDEETIERSYPIAPAVMGFYKPTEHWSFGLGGGVEFAKEDNLTLLRSAVEYSTEIRRGWEVFGSLQYDFRIDAYDTFTIGLGIGKQIGGKKRKK